VVSVERKMMKNKIQKIIFYLIFLWSGTSIYAQNSPPVNVEFSLTHKGTITQILFNKKLQSIPRLGVFSVTNVITDWQERKPIDIMHQTGATFQIVQGLNFVAGYHYTEVTGLRGSASLMYSHFSKNHILVLVPRIDLTKDTNYEIFGSFQFTPKLKDEWKWYGRVQGLYVLAVQKNIHQRSYMMVRMGLSYREFSFGAAADFDYFGPTKENMNNYGVFVAADLF